VDSLTTDALDVIRIPEKDFPFLALTDNMQSFFSAGIKLHEKGSYNHLMWYVAPNVFISQDWTLRRVPAKEYLSGNHRVKLITNPAWNIHERGLIKRYLNSEVGRPWYKRLYDPLQIVGLAVGLRWLQIPGRSRICSDYASVLRLVDENYDLEHPSPTEVNDYTKKNNHVYRVYMRFIPD